MFCFLASDEAMYLILFSCSVPNQRYNPDTCQFWLHIIKFPKPHTVHYCLFEHKIYYNTTNISTIFLQCPKSEIWTPHFILLNMYCMSQNHSSIIKLVISVNA